MQQEFQVTGMSCGHCAQAVREAVQALDAAAEVRVDRAGGRLAGLCRAPPETLRQAIEDAGYQAA